YLDRAGRGGHNVAVDIDAVTGELQIVVVDDESLSIEVELAVARILDRAAVVHAEEALAVDSDVEWIVGGRDRALVELLRDRRNFGADAYLNVGGATAQRIGEHVCKVRIRG